jgi:membrane-associated protease RseP (regulator of RpoE activity)
MEERKNLTVVVIVIAIVGLLLSCVAGAVAGGLTGYLVARREARVVAGGTLGGTLPERLLEEIPWLEEELPLPTPGVEEEFPWLGMRGALITEVLAGTPAEEAGLSAGDIITAVDSTPVDPIHELSEVLAQYEPGDRVTLTIWRAGDGETMRVTLGEHPDVAGAPYLGIRYRMRGPGSWRQGG